MKRKYMQTAIIGLMAAGIWIGAGTSQAQAQELSQPKLSPTDIKVQVNDSLLELADAPPVVDGHGALLVPLRTVSENMGLQVHWAADGEKVTVILTGLGSTAVITTGDPGAVVNSISTSMETPAVYWNGRVYVPLRFVADSFGTLLQWDNDNRIAIIGADGKYHGPAWYKPVRPKALEEAYRYIGTPYLWGGNTPEAFDCSGFVRYVYGPLGVSLPRTSKDMFAEAGTPVSDLLPGDLVFFAHGGAVDHVGIYTGDGQFISATRSKGVQVTPIATGYWAKLYVGAKRVS